MLSHYDEQFIPNLFGLRNHGQSLCYLNSLIQALMSCSSFNEHILNNLDSLTENKRQIAIEYAKLYMDNENGTKAGISSASKLQVLLHMASKNNILIGEQACINEAFIFLLEAIDGAEKLFHIRYNSYIRCRQCEKTCYKCKKIHAECSCDKICYKCNSEYKICMCIDKCRLCKKLPVNCKCHCNTEVVKELPHTWINLSEENPIVQRSLTTKESIEKYVMNTISVPEDYSCEKCGVKNTKTAFKIFKESRLHMLSEIIIIIFPSKADTYSRGKELIYFPESLDFPSINGNLHYKLVSQVEHYGTIRGGHWIARCLRQKPAYIDEHCRDRLQTYIKSYENRIKLFKDEPKKVQAFEQNLSNCKKKLEDIEKDKSTESVFNFNDTRVNILPEGFKPTRNTYMVFYHLA